MKMPLQREMLQREMLQRVALRMRWLMPWQGLLMRQRMPQPQPQLAQMPMAVTPIMK